MQRLFLYGIMTTMQTDKNKLTFLDENKIRHMRTLVQSGFAVFCLWGGYRFYLFYLWGAGRSEAFVPRPPSVEAFLPISALMGLKRFVLSGAFDPIHPAGLTIFMAALTIGLLARKGFCGWICPVGFTSNLVEKISKKIKILWMPPSWIDYPLLSLKYLLLAFFAYIILLKMPLEQIESFQKSSYNMVADAKMLLFFLNPSGLAAGIMIFLVLISFVIRNFWCRYLCPYGALLGILSFASPMKIKRDMQTCIDCKKCEETCPASIRITRNTTVRSADCIGCGECAAACPVDDCLTLAVPSRSRVPLYLLPTAVLGIFFLFWFFAVATGHWHTAVPPEVMKQLYPPLAN